MLLSDISFKQNLNLQVNLNSNQSLIIWKATTITGGKKFLIWQTNVLIQYFLKKQIINSKQKNIIYDKWENDSLCDYYDNEVISCLILKIRFIVFNSYNEKDLLKSSHCITIVKLQTKLNTNTKYQRHNPPFTILVIEYVTVQSTDFELQLPMCYWWFHRLLPSFVILSKSLYSSVPQFPYLKNENNENPHVVVVRMKWDNMKLNLEQSGI